jgi:PAS domain S-box-containing protein
MRKSKESPYLSQIFFNMLFWSLFIPLMIVAFMRVLGVGYLAKQNFENYQKHVTKSIAQIIDSKIEHGEITLDTVARMGNASNKKEVPVFMKGILKSYGYFKTVYCVDKYNKVKYTIPFDSRYIRMDISKLSDFKKSLNKKKVIISRMFISKSIDNRTIYLIRPIAHGGALIGEINTGLLRKEIVNVTANLSYDKIFILDKKGTLIKYFYSKFIKNSTGLSRAEIKDIGNSTRMKKTGWLVIDKVSVYDIAGSYVLELILTIIATLAIWLILIFKIRKRLQKYVVMPLNYLTKKTNALAIGDFSEANLLEVALDSFAELNNLSVDFQCMSNDLQTRETVLQESEKHYRGLINRLPIGIFSATLTGEILDINPIALVILGYHEKKEIHKVNIIDFLRVSSIDNEEKRFLKENIYNLKNIETKIKCCNGKFIWVQINTHMVFEWGDQEGFFEGSIQDITYRKDTEAKIKEQQELLFKAEKGQREELEKALIMKNEFISLISHEFKTPLNVIYSAIQLIEYAYIDKIPERVQKLIGNIKQNTFRQLRLVNNLLDITRINSGQVKLNMRNIDVVFLTKAITQSVELYANQKDIKISFASNINKKIISMDEEKLERIILNIISNAIKFTKEGGQIAVTLTEDNKSSFVQLKVSDTGIGIPKDKQELIFERFGQVDSNLSRQAEGTGIGLSLVKLFVDILGGTIEVESELNIGSTFIITLPEKIELINNEPETYINIDDKLVSEIKVQFSDIYL